MIRKKIKIELKIYICRIFIGLYLFFYFYVCNTRKLFSSAQDKKKFHALEINTDFLSDDCVGLIFGHM